METGRLSFCFLASRDWTNPESAGGDLYLSNLARGLARKGHMVTYISQWFHGAPADQVLDGVKIIRLRPGLGFALRQMRQLRRVQKDIDLVVEEMFGGKKSPALSLPISRSKLALAWYQCHERIFAEQYPRPLARVLSRLEHIASMVYRNTPVVTLSSKSASELSRVGVRPAQIRIVPSAAVLETTPQRLPFNKRQDRLVFIGKIRKYKRIDHALQCLKRVNDNSPDGRKAQLVIAGNVGKDDEPYLNHLKDLSHELGIDDCVEFRIYPGLIPQHEKAVLLASSKLLLQTSPVEGFSMTSVEANMCGTPVIVSDGVPRDVVSHGDNGFVYRFGDIDSMAAYSDKLLKDGGLWTQLSSNGLKAARKFTWENSSDLMELVAAEVRTERRPRSRLSPDR